MSAERPTGFTQGGHPVTVEALAAKIHCCAICGASDVATIAIFEPNTATTPRVLTRFASHGPVLPGRHRCVVYGLCAVCSALDRQIQTALVEARIFAGIAP